MKKISMILSATLAVFALASCKQDININPADGETVVGSIPFELAASVDELATRTTLDADTWNVTWESDRGDEAHTPDVIYAVTEDKEWGKPYSEDAEAATVAEFVYNGSTFSTESTISDGEHTFYFIYSNNDQKTWHRAVGTTNQLAGTQSMDATAPTAGLRAYDALAGKVPVTTPTGSIAKVTMSHLYTLMKVTLKNQTGADITVTSFSMSVAEGNYLNGVNAVNFSGETPVATYNNKYGSNKVTVDIANGEIKAGANLDVYFVILPLTNYSGDVTFQVTTTNSTFTKTNTVSDLSFEAGSHNSASYTLKNASGGGDESKTSTLNFTAKCDGSGTADDNVAWTVTSDGSESNFDNTKGIHYGTGKVAVQYITLSTSDISGTISKVVVNASTASGVTATVGVTVGGNVFGGDARTLTSSAADYTFVGSASGTVVVTVTKPESATGALYVKSIEVTYLNGTGGGSGSEQPTATVVTGDASDIAADEATLSGSYSGATGTITETGFEYGTSSSLGSSVYVESAGDSFSAVVGGLAASTTYYYRAYAKESVGGVTSIRYGTTKKFTTLSGGSSGEAGTLEHPYTVAEALNIIKGYSDKQKSETQVYVSGIIANVGSYNSKYHSVTYDISDDGQNSNTLNIYSGKYVDNSDFSSNEQIAVNDEVIVYGYLYLYGETKEMYQNNYIYSLNGKTKALTAGSLTATPDNDNKQITVAWEAAIGTESAISYVVTCGTQIYNATAAGSHTFTMADYGTYDVTVVASAADALSATVATSVKLTDPSAGANYYVKVTSITAGKRYLIVGGGTGKVLVPSTGSGRKESADVTISSDKIESTATVDANAVTIIANGSNYDITFKSGSETYYLQYGNSSTNLATATSSSETKTWNVVAGDFGTFRFKDVSTAEASTKRGLVFRAGESKFGGYSLGNVNGTEYFDIDLYEYDGN